ncbi:MAG: hypothetical protein U1F76_17980 [Candidatus Competibacteraceae bacterium]
MLKPHTDATRRQYRASRRILAHIPDKRLTHYLEDIEFPANAVQSFYITHPHEKDGGLPRLSLMGIHLPRQSLHRATLAVHRPGALYSSKATSLSLGASLAGPDPVEPKDLADFVDMTEAAKVIVFHHPDQRRRSQQAKLPDGISRGGDEL